MATLTSTNLKKFGDVFSGERFDKKLTYDFSVDAGAAADAIRIGQAAGKCIITEAYVHVETACTSGGSATVAIGVEGGDVDAFLDITSGAVANLTDDAVLSETTGQGIVMAADAYVLFDIATADLTAGKVNLYLSGYNAA